MPSLQESSFFDGLPVAAYCKNKEGVYIAANEKALQLVQEGGYGDFLVGKKDLDIFPENLAKAFRSCDLKVMATGKEIVEEEEVPIQNGQIRNQLTIKRPLLDDAGSIMGVVGITLDISFIKQKELNLKAEKETIEKNQKGMQTNLNSILHYLPGFLYWKDKNSVYLGCNENFSKAAGLDSLEDIVGKTDYELAWGATEAELFRKGDQEVLDGHEKHGFEEPQLMSGGRNATVLATKVALLDEQKNPVGVLGIYSDITERKKMEVALKEALIAAQAASAAKTEFIRNMSHDLRTPLMGIIGMAEIINRLPEARMTQEGAHDIHQAGMALLNLLNEIIATAQLDSGEMTHKKGCFELKNTIDALTVIFKPAIKQKGLKLEIYYDDNIPKILFGQELLLHRIILNLLANAVKFTEKGSINLELSLLQRRSDKVSIKMVVKDSGIGIPQNKQEIIFDKFSRLTPSYENQYQGSGLGLYMVKQFIEKLGGDIKVTSVPGKGAQFTCTVQFKLPSPAQLKKYQKMMVSAPPSKLEIKPTPQKSVKRVGPEPKVLLVEDNELIQKTTVANLQSWGYSLIDVAKTGQEALDRLAQKRYDLVYLDLGLPDFDGTIVAEKVCQDAHSPNQHTPFIALTAHADQKLITECLEKGIKQVLDKPLLADAAKKMADQFLPPAAVGLRVDWALWEKRCGDNKELVKETLALILKELPEFKASSDAALAQKNYQELAHIIHKFCGGLKYCGFPQLEAATFELLQALRQEHYNEVASLYQIYCQELDAVMAMNELQG